MASQKIAVYSIPDLKNTTDDALPNYLNSLKFKQSHYLTDVRLTLGYGAVVIAAITFLADYKLGWDATKAGTFWAVLVYFLLNGAFTIWLWQVEGGTVFLGEKDGAKISIATSVAKYTPIYNVKIKVERQQPGGEEIIEKSAPFTLWFDVEGHFVPKPFQQWLASIVPLIADADPGHTASSESPLSKNAVQTTSSDAALQTPKKRGRPKKE